MPDCVGKTKCCTRSRALIHSGCGAGVKCNDGGTASPTRGSVLRVFARAACAGEALAAVDRSLRRTRRAAAGIGGVLQRDGSAIDRPGAADSHADRRLLLCYPLEAGLCEEVHLNLAYRWFCRLGLNGEVPDHSTF